jgi:hypothetical protein
MNTEKPLTFADKVAASSQVRHVSYDAEQRQLHVVFRRTPALYVYSDFPAEKWDELQASDSIGSYLYKRVTRPIDGELPYLFEKRELPEDLKEEAAAQ